MQKSIVEAIFVKKVHKDYNNKETKKTSNNMKAGNILISALSVNIYFLISHYKTPKTMWGALQVLNEGTEDVNHSKINTLTWEYEPFHMELGQFVASIWISSLI